MKNTIHYLRTHRKNTHITQYDIAALMRVRDNTIVSRCEQGGRIPSLKMIITYHLLFDIPVLDLFSNHVRLIKERLIADIPSLISQIEDEGMNKKVQSRIQFLNEALTRLTQSASDEK